MIWNLIDQYVYVSIILVTLFITLHRKNKLFSGIYIIVIFLLSRFFLINLLLGIPLIFVTTIAMFFIFANMIEEYQQAKIRTSNFYIELIIFVSGIAVVLYAFFSILNGKIFVAYDVINMLDYFSVIVGIYFVATGITNVKLERQNLIIEQQNHLKEIETKRQLLIQNELSLLENKEYPQEKILEIEGKLEEGNFDTELTTYIPKANLTKYNDILDEKIYTEQEIEYLNRYKSDNKKNIFVIVIILLIVLIVLISSQLGTKTLNMEELTYLEYDNNQYIADVTYFVPWEHYDPNYFYTDEIEYYKSIGYEEDIEDFLPFYDEDTQNELKKLKIKVALSQEKDLVYGDEVEINVLYNNSNAKKSNYEITNTHFTKTVDRLKHSIDISKLKITDKDLKEIQKLVEETLKEDSISYTNIKLDNKYYQLVEQEKYNISYLVLDYSLDGKQAKSLINKNINNISVYIEVYEQNDEIHYNFENMDIKYEKVNSKGMKSL